MKDAQQENKQIQEENARTKEDLQKEINKNKQKEQELKRANDQANIIPVVINNLSPDDQQKHLKDLKEKKTQER